MAFWSEYQLPLMIVAPMLAMLLLYLLRRSAHSLLQRLARSLHRLLRLAARGCQRAEQRIRLRNHEVTKALAEALMERQLERRFMRIERLVERDLDNYQKLSAQINRQLSDIGEDYEASGEVPGPAPEWIAAVEALANLEGDQRNSEVMSRILGDMHTTVQQHHRETLREHRWTVAARHKVLAGLRPQWRKLAKLLEHIDQNIEILRQRLRQVDRHMGQFELLTAGSGQGIMSSMLMRFVIALGFVSLATVAAWVNLHLLQEPLAEILNRQQIGGLPLADLMAAIHIGITLVAASLVTESLRITHLLPLAGAMTRRGRTLMMWTGITLLSLAIGLESVALLDVVAMPSGDSLSDLPALALSLVGVAIPLVVAISIIPLEYLLHTVRPVLGSCIQVLMHLSAMVLRLLAALSIDLGKLATIVYDAVIVLPLLVERTLEAKRSAAAGENPVAAQPPPPARAQNVTALRFGANQTRQD